MKTDWDIREDVLCELAWEPAVKESQIGVQVVDGVVVLGGIVRDPGVARAAVVAAHRAPGVRDVISALTFEGGGEGEGGRKTSDLSIARAVRAALEAAPAAEPQLVRTTVAAGIVTLAGVVHSAAARAAAAGVVGRVAGVRRVDNGLAVDPRAAMTAVEDVIQRALGRRAPGAAAGLQVRLDGDRVHVSGKVPSLADRQAVLAALAAWPGFEVVEEELEVGGAER